MQPVLRLGAVGDSVAELHQTLIEQGYPPGGDVQDGIFGVDTRNAVCLFQGGHVGPDGRPLGVDGVVGERTWWALANPSAQQGAQPDDLFSYAPPASIIATAALKAALGELKRSVREDPNGSNRGPRIDEYTGFFGRPAGLPGPPWCAYFVSYCFAQAPGGSPFGRIGNAQNIGHWGRKRGATVPGSGIAQPGDIFVIARDDVHGHCGIVWATNGASIRTIEGNAGNAVRSLTRPMSTITVFVRPDLARRVP